MQCYNCTRIDLRGVYCRWIYFGYCQKSGWSNRYKCRISINCNSISITDLLLNLDNCSSAAWMEMWNMLVCTMALECFGGTWIMLYHFCFASGRIPDESSRQHSSTTTTTAIVAINFKCSAQNHELARWNVRECHASRVPSLYIKQYDRSCGKRQLGPNRFEKDRLSRVKLIPYFQIGHIPHIISLNGEEIIHR